MGYFPFGAVGGWRGEKRHLGHLALESETWVSDGRKGEGMSGAVSLLPGSNRRLCRPSAA